MIIEICANSYESALYAQKAGADRIELCVELAVGGITPSYGLLKKVRQDISIPVNVLIRPRSGNFTYSTEELEIMKQDILLCKELGFHGIVSGFLKEDHTVDPDKTRALIELARPLSFTFHRAFDWVPKPLEALDILRNMEVDRILSSGQQRTAIEGIGLLKVLKEKADDK
ncbi:MAG: copper homeostasis protein CutC, partial [Flavobacteriaceae bacterium]|nr:copper homeostasis protein CutC [Flavobacteriaceae bacterium]